MQTKHLNGFLSFGFRVWNLPINEINAALHDLNNFFRTCVKGVYNMNNWNEKHGPMKHNVYSNRRVKHERKLGLNKRLKYPISPSTLITMRAQALIVCNGAPFLRCNVNQIRNLRSSSAPSRHSASIKCAVRVNLAPISLCTVNLCVRNEWTWVWPRRELSVNSLSFTRQFFTCYCHGAALFTDCLPIVSKFYLNTLYLHSYILSSF